MLSVATITASSAGGRFTASVPTLTYAGSGTTNNGQFTITNYDSTFTYTISGTGSRSTNTLTVTNATSSVTLTATSPKGLTASSSVTCARQAATSTPYSYFVATGPSACHGCSAPLGHAAPCCAGGGCGCGTFHASGFAYPGFWACCAPGYTATGYTQNSYTGSGYTWGGSDYTNALGEWYKIT